MTASPRSNAPSIAAIPADATARAKVVAREASVIAGLALVAAALRKLAPDIALAAHARDGDSVAAEAYAIARRVFGPPGGQIGKDVVAAIRGTVNGLVLVGLGEGPEDLVVFDAREFVDALLPAD